MRSSDAQLVLGTEHAQRLDAADLRPLDLELLLAAIGVEHRADRRAERLHSGPAVRSAADDLQRLARADIHRGNVQVVRIGMVRAGFHLGHDDTLQPAADGLDLLETLDFEADVREDADDLLGRKIGREVAFEPIIRNVHITLLFDLLLKSNKGTNFRRK